MTEHKKAADYHRAQANVEVAKQGRAGTSAAEFASSRSAQMHHTNAAHSADRAHAAATGQTVVYTPIGTPVFRK